MRFIRRFGALLTLSLAFALFCGEVPESLNLSDDVSNDFVEPTHESDFASGALTRQQANRQQSAAVVAAFPAPP